MVFDNGVVGATWDHGVNAFDEALGGVTVKIMAVRLVRP